MNIPTPLKLAICCSIGAFVAVMSLGQPHFFRTPSTQSQGPVPPCLKYYGNGHFIIIAMQEIALSDSPAKSLTELKSRALVADPNVSGLLPGDFRLFLTPDMQTWASIPQSTHDLLGFLTTPECGTTCSLFFTDGHTGEALFSKMKVDHPEFLEIHDLPSSTNNPAEH